MFVYKCTNLINGKIYIGKTNNFEFRRKQHLRNIKKYCTYFYNAINKYGKNNFYWDILNNVETDKEAFELEKFWIKYFKSNDSKFGYNMTNGGEGISGFKHNSKTKNKIKEKRKNQIIKHSEETKRKISESNKGKTISKKCREKISKTKKGTKIIGESLERIQEANKIASQKRIILLKNDELINLIKDYQNGFSIYYLTKKYNISFRVIKRNLLKNNIRLRNHSQQAKIMNRRRFNEN